MFVPVQDMKAYEGVEVWLHPFSTSTLYVGEWSPLHVVCLQPVLIGKKAGWAAMLFWKLWNR